MAEIRYLKHKEIDQMRWDKAIDKAYNGLVYPYAFFLNAMAGERWDALVMDDYKTVFPLVWNSKYGMKYLYQPFFCQQLGLFSETRISETLLQQFIDRIPSKFRYWNFHLNYENTYFSPQIRFVNRTSYTVDLDCPYTDLYDRYNADARKNLARAVIHGYNCEKQLKTELVADCFFNAYGQHYPQGTDLRQKIVACAEAAISLNKGFSRAVYGPDGTLWCAGFFFHSNGRIHYAMAAPTDAGKKLGATHVLIDEVIKEFSGTKTVFDFEGSDIGSVAYFYAKFGSVPRHYLQIIRNRLPWWCRFLKA